MSVISIMIITTVLYFIHLIFFTGFQNVRLFCGNLVVLLLSSYTIALVPSWLSAVSFKCCGEDGNCAGALIDRQWTVTTTSCLQKCYGDSL